MIRPGLSAIVDLLTDGHDLFGRTITVIVSLIGNREYPQLVRAPTAGDGRSAAGTVQGPSTREAVTKRH
jgi:hypothetical protein